VAPQVGIVLQILTILSLVGGFLAILIRAGVVAGRFVRGQEAMAKQMEAMQEEIKAMREIMSEVAVQKVRLDTQAEHIVLLNKRYEELKQGRGLIVE
jgi:hypothetical protein